MKRKLTLREAFEDRVLRLEKSCWQWRGYIHPVGYGSVQHKYVKYSAHRLAWELYVGPIPDGMVIDHCCLNRACVNPEHLECVTVSENSRRTRRTFPRPLADIAFKDEPDRHRLRRVCKNGHPRSPENTYNDKKQYRCKLCARDKYLKKNGYFDPNRKRATHCPKGHEYTSENVYEYVRDGRTYRYCRECNRQAKRKAA